MYEIGKWKQMVAERGAIRSIRLHSFSGIMFAGYFRDLFIHFTRSVTIKNVLVALDARVHNRYTGARAPIELGWWTVPVFRSQIF